MQKGKMTPAAQLEAGESGSMSTNSAAAISTAGAKTDKTNAGTSSLSMSLEAMKAKLNSWANDEESSTVTTDAGQPTVTSSSTTLDLMKERLAQLANSQ